MTAIRQSFLVALGIVCAAFPQASDQNFEVASVKPSKGGPEGFWNEGATVRMLNKSLQAIIAAAYGVKDHVVFGPAWIDSERFEIIAKIAPETAKLPDAERWAAIQTMSRNLLAERFKLHVHHEDRDMRVFALVPAKGGVKLVETGPPSTTWARVSLGRGSLAAKQMPMAQLISILGGIVHFQVLDETGVSGVFDIALEWLPEENEAYAASSNKAPLATAIQEQIGLKLEARKIRNQVLIVDSAERPTGN